MALAQSQTLKGTHFLFMIKSFLIWMFTLAVCLLVIGFPAMVIVVAVGSLLSISLHAILPVSSVLLIAGSIIGLLIAGVMFCSAMLTLRGVHPQEVEWLRWLSGEENPRHTSIYAACPLTCDVEHPVA